MSSYEQKIENLKPTSKKMIEDAGCVVHNWHHILRVLRNAKKINEKENGNWQIIEPAIYLHDCIRPVEEEIINDHASASAKAARPILEKLGFENINEICSCIYKHSSSSSKEIPKTIEEKIVWDADKMDGFGEIGVARTLVLSGEMLWSIEKSADKWLEEIKRVGKADIDDQETLAKKWLFTETSRKLSKEDVDIFIKFFKKIQEDLLL